jgi:glycine/serine hydroxymethyltransferase
MAEFQKKIEQLVKKTEQNNVWRQRECINLIPSESTPSLLVKMCSIADASGRYAEHRVMKGKEVYFYQGIDFIRDVEEDVRKEMQAYFNCTNVELRPISGQMANDIVFKAMVKFINRGRGTKLSRRMRAVINNDLKTGGHLSDQPMGALFNLVEENPATGKEFVYHFPGMPDNPYKTDVSKLAGLIAEAKPELIIFGKSMFLYQEPVKAVYELTKNLNPRPILMYDMAHTLGLYGAFQDPLAEGADVVTGSTHKTFFGPQRGVIVSNMNENSGLEKLWSEIKSRALPGSTSNHHLGTLLGLLVASYEMNYFKAKFQKQVIANARAFAKALNERGVIVEGDPADGFTETHQVLIRVRQYGISEEIALRLEQNNIITNYQALPDDGSFVGSSGIRMGVQEMTRFGMKEKDFAELADYMADCIMKNRKVGGKVKEFRQQFQEMQYCLPIEKAAPLAARVLESTFANTSDVELLTDALSAWGQ